MKDINNYYNNIDLIKRKKFVTLVDWPNKKRQLEEFRMLTSIIEKNQIYTLTDYGCGTGDIIKFLKKKPNKYYGYDINKEFISICKKRFKNKNYFFFQSDKIKYNADYTIASGAFSIKGKINNKLYFKKMLNVINNILNYTNKKIAVNFHWDVCPPHKRRSHIYYTNIKLLKNFLKKKNITNFKIKTKKKKYVFYLFVNLKK